MVRNTVKKRKLNDKPAPKKTKRKNIKNASRNATSSQNCSTISDLNYTLPEGKHLDSFDIFRSNEEQVLRAKNELKKDIDASYNRDSSVDYDDNECLHLTDPLSTSSVILIQEKENTINIDETDSFNDQTINFAKYGKAGKKSRFEYGPKYKSSTSRFLQQNAIQTSTPQKSISMLPAPNQHFDEIEPITEEIQSDSICGNEDGISDEMIIQQTTNVAARKRRPPTKIVQIHTSIPEGGRRTTRSNGIVRGNTIAGADEIQIDNNQVERVESNRTSTRTRNTDEYGNTIVRRRVKNSIFNSAKTDNSSSSSSENEHEQLSVDVDVHGTDKTASIKLASLPTAKASNSTKNVTTIADESSLTYEHSQRTETHGENRTTEMTGDKSHDILQSSCSNNTSSENSGRLNRDDASNRLCVQANNQQIDNISISSVSFDLTPMPNKDVTTTPASISNENRLTKTKTKVGFNTSCFVHEKSTSSENTSHENAKIVMKGGKWRRTIVEIRKNKSSQLPRLTLQSESDRNSQQSIRRKSIFIKDIPDQNRLTDQVRARSQIVTILDDSEASIHRAAYQPKSSLITERVSKRQTNALQTIRDSFDIDESETSAISSHNGNHRLSICHETLSNDESSIDDIEKSTSNLHIEYDHDELKAQLLKRCGQSSVLAFNEVYSARLLRKCKKIGEGVFGEVFLHGSTVLKIIPIAGDIEINGALQKRFDEILQEVIISQELSALRLNEKNFTAGFVEVVNVRLVKGAYPAHLLKLWDEYDARKESENDRPDMFDSDQLYIVFELMNGGCDLEAHEFKNADQSFSVFKQVAVSLAVAESQFQFEHRDLHWGNVLVAPTTERTITFHLNGKQIKVQTHGIKVTIIDYTLSRIVYKNCCLFQDLAADPELFEAMGDYQYEIYRLMRDKTKNCWAIFEPYTNVLWLHYIIDKITSTAGVKYAAKRGVKHRQIINEMLGLRDNLLEYQSATKYAEIL